MRRGRSNFSIHRRRSPKRFSLLLFTGISMPIILALVATMVFVLPRMQSHAAATTNTDCTIIVPANPLTAQGLATPYQLAATHPANGPCNESNSTQAAFVQSAVIDPLTGSIAIYDPLVIDKGTHPAEAPVVPTLPKGAVVGIWFGFNATNLTLQGTNGSLKAGKCVNGVNGSIFSQFSYCNAPAFFQAANQAILQKRLNPPPLGIGKDGRTCPSVRDFSVIDQDQSDNVTTSYLVTSHGTIAQVTAANQTKFPNSQTQNNGSDNRLLAIALDGALGCTPWMAPDLANPGTMVTALPLNELQAAAHQTTPIALVPGLDPMVTINNHFDLAKLNAYRAGVDQPPVGSANSGSTQVYCAYLRLIAPKRLLLDMPLTMASPSLDPAAANSLLTFLEQRFITSYEANGLNCLSLLKLPDPITVTRDSSGVAINGTINGIPNGEGGNHSSSPDCVINGTLVAGCTGTTTINGQRCILAFDANTKRVTISCPVGA